MSHTHPDDVTRATAPDGFHPNDTRRAWISLLCTALTLPAGIVAGSLIIDWLGYDPNNTEALPAGAALIAGSVALLIILSAPLMAFVFGRRAVHAGDGRGQLPMLLGGIGAAAFFALNMVQLVMGLFLD
jgi:Na+-driven multidrug efflux pump